MITKDKITEIFCIIDEFCKYFEQENGKKLLIGSDDKKRRMRKASMSDSEIMTILLIFHFGSFRTFNDDDLAVKEEFLNRNEGLKSMYKADDDNMAVLYITNGTARFCSFAEPERKVSF